MKSISAMFCLVCLMCGYGYGQVGTMEMIPQSLSPNAAALGKYVEMPVSYYSGLPQINIPLYELGGKDITVPISMSYHASGVKVKDIPGTTGAGFSLNSGGLITRIVRGIPDDHYPAVVNDWDTFVSGIRSRVRNAYLFDFTNVYTGGEQEKIRTTAPGVVAERASAPWVDTEYDVYYFNFSGFTGRFTFTNEGEILMLQASDLKVVYQNKKFKITDGKGIEYYFNDLETSLDVNTGYSPERHYVSSWFLSRINQPSKNEQISFQYSKHLDYDLYQGSYYPAFSTSIYKLRFLNATTGNYPYPPHCQVVGTDYKNGAKSGDTLLILERIIHDSDTARFYHNYGRSDSFKCKLDSFKVFHKREAVYAARFNYSYTNNSGEPSNKKLKLDSLKINDQPAYRFGYYDTWMGKGWPDIHKKGIDIWGYYNGEDDPTDNNGQFINPRYKVFSGLVEFINANSTYRNSDYKYGQLGTLKTMTYPTGGKTEFEYEGNSFRSFQYITPLEEDPGTNLNFDSIRHPGVLTYTEINDPNYRTDDSREFVIHQDQTVSLASRIGLYTNPLNPLPYQDYLDYVYNYGFGGTATIRLLKYNTVTNVFDLVEEQSYNPVTMIGAPLSSYEYNDLLRDYGVVINAHTRFLEEGRYKIESNLDGIGLYAHLNITCKFPYKKSAEEYNAGGLRIKKIKFSSPVNSSSFEKNYNYSDDGFATSGILESPIANLNSSMYWGEQHYIPWPYDQYRQELCLFLDVYQDPIIPLGNSQGGVIGYARVSEHMNDGRKTVYHFSNTYSGAADIYLEETYGSPTRLRILVDNSTKRGLLERVDYFNGNNQLVKKEVHHFYTAADLSKNSVSMPMILSLNTMFGWVLDPKFIVTMSKYALPLIDSVYYFKGADTLKEVTKYSYNLSKHIYPSALTKINSIGDSTVIHYKYPQDYTIPSASGIAFSEGIRNLQQRHVVSKPVETYVEKRDKGGNNARVVEAQLVSYKPALPVPDTVYTLNNTTGLTDFSAANFTVNTAVKDGRYKRRLLFNQYDNGDVVEQSQDNNVKDVLVWGYNRRYIVARVQGSSYQIVISLVDTNVVNNPSGDAAMRTELHKIRTALASSNPAAKVTTYTYTPLKGISSVTDPANRTIYYEYDSFGRLRLQKDQDAKVTDRIIYHYRP